MKVNTLANDTSEGIKAFGDEVLEASNRTGAGANDMAQAIYDAMSSGIDYANSLSFVEEANKLSVSGFTEVGKSVDIKVKCVA